jgi:hypothetical protein
MFIIIIIIKYYLQVNLNIPCGQATVVKWLATCGGGVNIEMF